MLKSSSPPSETRSSGARYGVAVLAVAVALLVKLGLERIVDTGAPFLLFPLAILAAAWLGGLRPGLLATVLSTVVAVPMFLLPLSASDLGSGAMALRTLVFLLQGVGISLIAHAFDQERHRADADASLARAALDEIRNKDRQLLLITDSLPLLVSYIDAGRRYRFVNKAYEDWFGIPRSEVLGQHACDVLGEAAYETVRPFFDEALAGRTVTYEREVPYALGGTRLIDATYIPHAGEDGRIEGLIALVTDASERKRGERELDGSA
ncbi:MAG TPA: PAS domain-containing protein [Thermoanaerobaculia bacterium]|nr:PAS domain-containing protein [Thermoanaerobaculia bacterium]